MKFLKSYAFIFTILFTITAVAANYTKLDDLIVKSTASIGSNTTPNSKSVLDLVSTTKGFLAPRMTTVQQNAISSPPEGLRIHDTTLHLSAYYNGTVWLDLASLTGTETLTNKTMSGSSNTFTSIPAGTALSGQVPVANGGTALSSGTSGGILGFTASGTIASSGALTASQLVIGGGAGATPSSLAAGTQHQVLVMGAANPGYGALNLSQAASHTGVLDVASGGTNLASGTSGGILGYTASGTLASSGALTVNQLIKGGGAGATPSTLTACSDGQIIKYASGIPACGSDSTGAGSLGFRSVSGTDSTTSSDGFVKLSGASFTLTLHTAVGNTGQILELSHNGTTLSQVYTLNTTSAQTIGGIASGSYKLATTGEVLKLISDGSNWLKVSHSAEVARTSYTPTFGTGFGTTTNVSFFWWRTGENLQVEGSFKSGTVTTGIPTISLPANIALNESSLSTAKTVDLGRAWGQISTTNVNVPAANRGPYLIGTQSGTTDSVFLSGSLDLDNDASGTFLTAQNTSTIFSGGNNTGWIVRFTVPVTGWQPQ